MYEITDKTLKKLKSQIWSKFLRTKASLKFDELNVIKSSKTLYNDLNKLNKVVFLNIARECYSQYSDKDTPSLAWVLAILGGYDVVTQYVYSHEVDRKRARFAESVIASGNQMLPFQRAYNLWYRQTEQYAVTIEDMATIKAYKDNGVKKVRWVTEKDSKVCSICRERDGKIYNIDNIEKKPHINCRCYVIPVTKEGDNDG